MIKSVVWHKLNGLLRYGLAHSGSLFFPIYVINEYPKSGASWVGEMLGEAINLPFPRNRLPLFASSILHGHMMQSWNIPKMLIVWRDGRDVLISHYFHTFFKNDRDNGVLVDKSRALLQFQDYNDIEQNLEQFMEYSYSASRFPRFSWIDFVDRWAGSDSCVHLRYEDIRADPHGSLKMIVHELTGVTVADHAIASIVEKHSFQNVSGRSVGEEKMGSFLRKGLVGDWKNYFTKEHRIQFNNLAGRGLIKLGYEPDPSWVD